MPGNKSQDDLNQLQLRNFGLDRANGLGSSASAEKFLKSVGIALRYWRTPNLPLASLYQAAWGSSDFPVKKGKDEPGKINLRDLALRKAIALTNHLLATHRGIEVNVIGKRLALVHRDLVPSLYVLVRHHRPVSDLTGVSVHARKVFQFIEQEKETTAGSVRKFLGIKGTDLNNDPAYQALAELQSRMLIDRGPFKVNKKGIPYLSKEGYPYHCFHLAHADLVHASVKLTRQEAARDFLLGYLRGAAWVKIKKLASMFDQIVTRQEIESGISDLVKMKKVVREKNGKDEIVVFKK